MLVVAGNRGWTRRTCLIHAPAETAGAVSQVDEDFLDLSAGSTSQV